MRKVHQKDHISKFFGEKMASGNPEVAFLVEAWRKLAFRTETELYGPRTSNERCLLKKMKPLPLTRLSVLNNGVLE